MGTVFVMICNISHYFIVE